MLSALRHLLSSKVLRRHGLPHVGITSPYDEMRERLLRQKTKEVFVTDDNRLRPLKSGRHVYVMSDGDMPVKIGVSNDPLRRCADLRGPSGRPLTVAFAIESAYADEIEKLAHKHFADKRTMGEWFNVPIGDAKLAIQGIANQLGSTAKVVSIPDLCRSVATHVQTLEMPVRAATLEFFQEILATSAGKEILFRDVCKSYSAMAPARMWPRLHEGISEKTLSQSLVKLGCVRGRRDLRKDDLGRLATLAWPAHKHASSLRVVA